jgi:cytochrome c peroxidase
VKLHVGLAALIATVAAIGTMASASGKQWRWDLPAGVGATDVPPDNPMSAAKVELGRRLFYDADLSIDGTIACATCHEQRRGFADGNATRAGVHGDAGRRNVLGLANVGWLSPLTWANPHLKRLEDQVAVPVLGTKPVEMGMQGKEMEIGHRLQADACYRRMFAAAFPERSGTIDVESVSAALAAFQRTMTSFDSPYDAYLRGRVSALSTSAQRGAALFFGKAGCANCHSGQDLTDARYHRFATSASDRGLSEKTGRAEDEWLFRTPSLRNVAITGPWLHDGSASTLADALTKHPAPPDVKQGVDLIAFLETTTDRKFLVDKRLAMPNRACERIL